MKHLIHVLFICIFSFLGGIAAQYIPPAYEPPSRGEHIVCESITIRKGMGKVSIVATDTIAGIWVQRGPNYTAMGGMYATKYGASMHVSGPTWDVGDGFDWAISADGDGPSMQFRNGKKLTYLSEGKP